MLYHFSDDPEIKVFVPRVIKNNDMPAAVWAIDAEHCVNYYFPRMCPRVIYGKSDNMSESDMDKFFAGTDADRIITITHDWKEQLETGFLYRYSFSEEGFELLHKIAGYHVKYSEAVPVKVERVDNLKGMIEETGTELRYADELYSLRDEIVNSTVDNFSIIRLKKKQA